MKNANKLFTVILFIILSVGIFSGCATTTPLQNAIIRNDIERAKQLAKRDQTTLDKKNSEGQTALILATIRTQEDVVRSILEAGANPNVTSMNGTTALIEAAYKGQPSIVKLLLKHGAEIDLSDRNGWTPLFYATKQNFYPVVKLLLMSGTNVNHTSEDGTNPLFLASMEGHIAIVNLLLSHSADPNSQNKEGMTPLMCAVLRGHHNIVKRLILKGAKTDLQSKEHKTAKDMAEENGFTELSELIGKNNSAIGIMNRNEQNKPLLIFKSLKVWFDEEEISPTWTRALELRTATGYFLDMLCECGLFAQVDTLDETNRHEEAIFISLIVNEFEDKNTGSNVTKAFLSGFFTLGLIPPSADYGYRSTMVLLVERSDGQNKEYRASSDTTASWRGDPRTAAYVKKAGGAKKSARRLVTHQVFESLISQLESDSFILEQQ